MPFPEVQDESNQYPQVFSPIRVGNMELKNRFMTPPHASAIGNIYGTEEEAARNIAYFEERCKTGIAWIGALSTWVRNTFPAGFEPTGVGAPTLGFFRLPIFVERIQQFSDTVHKYGTVATVQMVHQGGMPHGPSAMMSSPVINLMPHVMNQEDIDFFIVEYGESAALAQLGRADGVEVHINHDDLHEWFLSPLTNKRTDKYGGSLEGRCQFTVEVLRSIREKVGSNFTVGVRLNLREEVPGGYDNSGAIQIAQYLESTGLIDFVHGVVGSPWGNPSYIQPTWFEPAQWADLAGNLKRSISLPLVYTGRVTSPEIAEEIIASGNADVVGIARALIADAEFISKSREGRSDRIRPCIGCNECISRRYVENLGFACAVNPATSHELEGSWPKLSQSKNILVIGGGPAGMEFAALAQEGGHKVRLWEAESELGGQLRWAIKAPGFADYKKYLDWQRTRIKESGVEVSLNRVATAAEVGEAGADIVVVATGANPHRPVIHGMDQDHVFDIRQVLDESALPRRRVLVVAQDDHLAPLSVADFLATRGHEVTVVYATNSPAQLLGRYIVGAILGRLDENGVDIRTMEQVIGIGSDCVQVRNVYSLVVREIPKIDSVVLACGGVSNSSLYEEIKDSAGQVHILGDAYAPRRLVFATRQAYALADELIRTN